MAYTDKSGTVFGISIVMGLARQVMTSVCAGIALIVLSAAMAQACAAPDHLDKLRLEVIDQINLRRNARGLPKLALQGQLQEAAQGHACWISDRNKKTELHRGRGGSLPGQRVRAEGYRFSFLVENVAGGVSQARDIVDLWMRSPEHRRNILSARPRHIGVGIARGTGWLYWVMVGGDT